MREAIKYAKAVADNERLLVERLKILCDEIGNKLDEREINYHYKEWDTAVEHLLENYDSIEVDVRDEHTEVSLSYQVPYEGWVESGSVIITHYWADKSLDEIVDEIESRSNDRNKQSRKLEIESLKTQLAALQELAGE